MCSIAGGGQLSNLKQTYKLAKLAIDDVKNKKPYYHVSGIEIEDLYEIIDNKDEFTLKIGANNAFNPEGEGGVYFARNPLLYYWGSESERKQMRTMVIFGVPVDGDNIFNIGDTLNSLNCNSNNRNVRMSGIVINKIQEPIKYLNGLNSFGVESLDDNLDLYIISAGNIDYIEKIND